MRRSENVSCTMQVPCHRTMSSRPLCFCTQRPRCRSGANTIFSSGPKDSTTWTALDDVQIMSLMAFTSADELM